MPDDLDAKLRAAQKRAERARASLASLRRRVDGENRRVRTQRLCTIGAAAEAWCTENGALMSAFKTFLGRYLSRPADVQILRGTPFEIERPAPAEVPRG